MEYTGKSPMYVLADVNLMLNMIYQYAIVRTKTGIFWGFPKEGTELQKKKMVAPYFFS